VVDDEPVADFSQWEYVVRIAPFETIHDTIREAEIDEVEVDLATVVNGAPNSNQIVHFESQSATDPRAAPYIPEMIPGLTGFRLGIRSGSAADLVLEASVRVRDEGDRIETDEAEVWVLPVPATFAPSAPAIE
jgi:hypothetical protein